MDELLHMRDLTDTEKLLFQNEVNSRRKNATTAILLALFLGGLGAHHYYMGNILIGVLFTLFCWTFIPAMIAFIELFLLSGRVRRYNARLMQETAIKIKAIRSPQTFALAQASA